ncbi:CDP-alcohol phosphatidyltransferase family protein [Venenivibrio stagnispumantis]|uniref:CDP-diacylglycerol--glycerol-3-phosphate 3-phosphatidyltransferase n=1 Tax=Venenivibrio stagnispumantis TaxID=407998 RepID=A0AA45WL17_9AQUI|nr:CDP-alcohol phosphatidyltransferase family protein [Venenivibrio stagnispumantis]MCW4573671.1 CDP-alcohol phosphatidyltransferase family protein [Venenivibrio stagnispumantis]SMP09829.1 CDP-diacylglycerol--glycerol-3-phosphate 3-phosphatidyltransferase [Venenivibrio stagnispumantis]
MSALIKNIKPAFEKRTAVLVDFLYKINITPNILTIFGLIFVIIGSIFIVLKQFIIAGIFLSIGNILDAFDGYLARKYNQATKFGAFLDSVIDRFSDAFPLMAISYLLRNNDFIFFISLLSIIFSFMVSYTRARSEGLGIDCKVGIFERPERSIILIIGVFSSFIDIAVIIIAIGSFITFLQRVFYFYKKSV